MKNIIFKLSMILTLLILPIATFGVGSVYASGLDYTALNTAIQNSPYCTNMDNRYTQGSWEVYAPVMLSARELLTKVDATQQEIDEMAILLENSADALVSVVELRNQINLSIQLIDKASDYSNITFGSFVIAYNNAVNVLAEYNPTQNLVNNVTGTLQYTRENLLNVARYNVVISRIPADLTIFTTETVNRLNEKFIQVQSALNSAGTTQSLFDSLVYALDASITGLKYLANKSELVELKTELQELNIYDYTVNSRNKINNALLEIDKTLNINELTESEMNKVIRKYENLTQDLVSIKELRILVEQTKGKKGEQFAPTSFSNYYVALRLAKGCLNNANATKEQVQVCIDNLKTSVEELLPISTKEQLMQSITTAENLKNADISADSKNVLIQCIEESLQVYTDSDADEDLVSVTTLLINKTIQKVIKDEQEILAAKAQLKKVMDYILSLNPKNFAFFSWYNLQEQYTIAFNVINSSDSSLIVVEDAISTLKKSTNDLRPVQEDKYSTPFVIALSCVIVFSISLGIALIRLMYLIKKGKLNKD